MVRNTHCILKIFIVSFIIIFGTLSFPTANYNQRNSEARTAKNVIRNEITEL